MTNVPVVGIAKYNGYSFNNNANTLELSVTPVWDSSNRTIIYSVFRITITWVVNGRASDTEVRAAIALLTQPAAAFRYNGRGCGDIKVNLPGGGADCIWGPRPGPVGMKNLGAGNATRLTWTVQFAAPTCNDARYEGPMEFNYSTSINVDKSGYTQRTYKGHLVIAQTRANPKNRLIFRSADEFRELLNPPLLAGFRRIPGRFDLSEDKNRLDFEIRDEQEGPNFCPDGVIEAEADHVFNSKPGNVLLWTGTINATYELALDAPPSLAVQAFAKLAIDRLAAFRNAAVASRPELKPIPIAFTVSEPRIYGKTQVHLSMQYMVGGAKLQDILNMGGLWRPVPEAGWFSWVTSLKQPLSSRGWAQIRWRPGTDDSIVDLCGKMPAIAPPRRTQPGQVGGRSRPNPRPRPLRPFMPRRGPTFFNGQEFPAIQPPPPMPPAPDPMFPIPPVGGLGPLISGLFPVLEGGGGGGAGAGGATDIESTFLVPTPANSWIDYQVGVRYEVDQGTVVGRTLPTKPLTPRSHPTGAGSLLGTALAAAAQRVTGGGTFVQQRVKPICYVYLSGHAMRAGFPVPCPSLTSVDGAKPILCNRPDYGEGFEQVVVGNVFYPVYAARWKLRYVVPDPPAGALPVIENALLT